MNTYDLARNASTTLYEVHIEACAHTMSRKYDHLTTVRGATAREAATNFNLDNDGCIAVLGPCARRERSAR